MSVALCDKADEQRSRLLTAAERCFLRKGFHATRIAHIAEEAGVSPGLLYRYFDGKEEILAEFVRTRVEDIMARRGRAASSSECFLDFVVQDFKEAIADAEGPVRTALMLEILSEATRNSVVAAVISDADFDLRAQLKACLPAIAEHEDCEARIEMILCLLEGLRMRIILNPDMDVSAVFEKTLSVVRMILKGNVAA